MGIPLKNKTDQTITNHCSGNIKNSSHEGSLIKQLLEKIS